MKKQLALYLAFSFIISSSTYPLSKTDRAILSAVMATGALIGGILGYVGLDTIQAPKPIIVGGSIAAPAGAYLGYLTGKAHLRRKYGVSERVLNSAYQFNYDLSTQQKLILQAAEQKNNTVLKKYLEELFEQQFGENGIQKFISLMHEYQLIAKKNKPLGEQYKLFTEKVGRNNANLLFRVLRIGIVPIAILYFDVDLWARNISLILSIFGLEKQIKVAQDFMEAVGLMK